MYWKESLRKIFRLFIRLPRLPLLSLQSLKEHWDLIVHQLPCAMVPSCKIWGENTKVLIWMLVFPLLLEGFLHIHSLVKKFNIYKKGFLPPVACRAPNFWPIFAARRVSWKAGKSLSFDVNGEKFEPLLRQQM